MKRSLVVMLVMLSVSIQAQTEQLWNNFFKQDNQLFWQQISETELTFEELVDVVKLSGYYSDYDVSANQIICKLNPYMVNYNVLGFSITNTPFYLSRNQVMGVVVIEYKGNRIRKTVKNISFVLNEYDPLLKKYKTDTLERCALNNEGELRDSFSNEGSNILNQDFTSKTSFLKSNGDW